MRYVLHSFITSVLISKIEARVAENQSWPGACDTRPRASRLGSMSTNTLAGNESSGVPSIDNPLDSARAVVRSTLLDDDLPDFDVYQALCECAFPHSIRALERRG